MKDRREYKMSVLGTHHMPTTVWNPPTQSVKPPSLRVEELKRKGPETEGDGDSLLLNVELAAGAVSSILKDSDLNRSGALPVEEAFGSIPPRVASVSSHIFFVFDFDLSWVLILR